MNRKNFKRRKLCLKKFKIMTILAWCMLSNICAKIIDEIWSSLHSQKFISRHKTSPTAFTRHRKLPFHDLVLFLLGNLKSSYNKELDRFFHQINGGAIGVSDITKPAVSTARKYLEPEAFLELNNLALSIFEQEASLDTWQGFRPLAIDGTTLRLPNVKEIRQHFGERSGGQGSPCPLGRLSELYDPLNKLTINGILTPIDIGEREHAHQLLLHLMPNDLVVLDRGYPAFSLFKAIISMDGNFCARMTGHWKVVKNFLNSGLKEQIVELTPTAKAVNECIDMGLDKAPVTMRLLRIELSSGETEVLATTLTDPTIYPYDLFTDLYHQRWFVEEDYKTLKLPLELENFSGKTVHSIYQDCYAQLLSKNIVSILSFEARKQIKRAGKKGKHVHQINFTYALSKTKEVMARLFHSTRAGFVQLLKTLQALYLKKTEPIRHGRSYTRKHRFNKRVYHFNRKSIA
jgi:hypothetical protein